jgi:hypothetical protein
MSIEKLTELVYGLSFAAGMNQQYFQTQESRWSWWDTALRIAVALVTAVSLIATVASEFRRSARKDAESNGPRAWMIARSVSFWLSCLSFLLGAALAILPVERSARQHGDRYAEWTALRQQADELLFDLDAAGERGESAASVCGDERYRRLLALRAQIEALESNPNAELVRQCFRDEYRRRHGKDPDEKILPTAKS